MYILLFVIVKFSNFYLIAYKSEQIRVVYLWQEFLKIAFVK